MGAHYARLRAIANSQFGGGASSWAPGTWHLGLSTTAPNPDGLGFLEPVGNGYLRLAVLNNTAFFPDAQTVGGLTTKTNGLKLTFADPTGPWGLIGWYGWFVAPTGGLPEYSNQMDSPITVRGGNTPVEFDASQMVLTWS